jgi:hypothetical protein
MKNREEYLRLKSERCEFLWKAIERSIPDVRTRVLVDANFSASPKTHERFNRRYKGTFGPALRAGEAKFPYPKTGNADIPFSISFYIFNHLTYACASLYYTLYTIIFTLIFRVTWTFLLWRFCFPRDRSACSCS